MYSPGVWSHPILEFLTGIFNQALEYNTICSNRSAISAYNDSICLLSVGKYPCISNLFTRFLIRSFFNQDTASYGCWKNTGFSKLVGFWENTT